MRMLIVLLITGACSGCATISTDARTRVIQEKTEAMTVGMSSNDLIKLLGAPTTREAAPCFAPLSNEVCHRWTYDPSEGWPIRPYGTRLLDVTLKRENGTLRVINWRWY